MSQSEFKTWLLACVKKTTVGVYISRSDKERFGSMLRDLREAGEIKVSRFTPEGGTYYRHPDYPTVYDSGRQADRSEVGRVLRPDKG